MTPETDPSAPPERLEDCPETLNCVSSQASDAAKRVAPLVCGGDCRETLRQLRAILESTRGATVETATETYIRARFTTPVFRFVDDLELLADTEEDVVHVRSASRVGTWDLGVNRRRVEALRKRLERLGR